jgi:hypothetical protein
MTDLGRARRPCPHDGDAGGGLRCGGRSPSTSAIQPPRTRYAALLRRGPRLAAAFYGLTIINPLTLVLFVSLVVAGGPAVGTIGWALGMALASLTAHGGFVVRRRSTRSTTAGTQAPPTCGSRPGCSWRRSRCTSPCELSGRPRAKVRTPLAEGARQNVSVKASTASSSTAPRSTRPAGRPARQLFRASWDRRARAPVGGRRRSPGSASCSDSAASSFSSAAMPPLDALDLLLEVLGRAVPCLALLGRQSALLGLALATPPPGLSCPVDIGGDAAPAARSHPTERARPRRRRGGTRPGRHAPRAARRPPTGSGTGRG